MENKLFCSVCLDENTNILSCKHLCCVSCAKKIIKINARCPICRANFDITPYKYVPPKRLHNLKFLNKNKKMLNRFLRNRNFLLPCKKQRLYAHLLFRYTDQICFRFKYIHIDGMLIGEITYDVNILIDCLLWLNQSNNKLYSYTMKQNVMYAIRSSLSAILM